MAQDPQTQFLEIPVDGGVDTLTAPERVAPPKHLRHEDGSLREPGAVNKRLPFSAYTKSAHESDDTVINGFRAMLTDNSVLVGVGAGDATAYAYEGDADRWIVADKHASFPVTRRRDVYAAPDIGHVGLARVSDWLCVYVHASVNDEPFVTLIISERNWTLRRETFLNITAIGLVRIAAVGDRYFVAVYADSANNLKAVVYDTATNTSDWGSPVTLAAAHASWKHIFDLWSLPGSSDLYVAYNAATGIAALRVIISGGVATVAASATYAGDQADQSIAIAGDNIGGHARLVIGYCLSSAGVKAFTIATPALGVVVGPVVVDAGTIAAREIGILTYRIASTNVATIAFSNIPSATTPESWLTKFRRYNVETAAFGGGVYTIEGVALYLEPFQVRGADLFGLARYQDLENTVYLFADQFWSRVAPMATTAGGGQRPVARMLPYTFENFSNFKANGRIVPVCRSASLDLWYAVACEPDTPELFSSSDTTQPNSRVCLFEIDFRADHCHRQAVIDDLITVAGSLPRYYDRDMRAGPSLEPARGFVGFVPLHSPVVDTLVPSNGAGLLDVNGVYKYRYTFEYHNRAGQRCQSLPSTEYSVTLGAADDTVTHNINGTKKQGPNPGMTSPTIGYTLRIVIWRQINPGDGIFYRAGEVLSDALTFIDLVSDTVLSTREVLYTVSGELANIPAPPCLALVAWKDRLVALHAESRELWVSKSLVANELQGWNEALVVETDVWRSRPIYASSLDDKMIVWWADAIGVVYGEPASDTGQQGTMQVPVLVARGIGLAERASLVETPIGLFFRSVRGIYLLDHGLGLTWIGRDVAGLVPSKTWASSNAIVGAGYLEDTSEVYFVFEGAFALVYHIEQQQWHQHILGDAAGFPA